MEKIEVIAELLFELKSKTEWINKVPGILPDKTLTGETWLWIDKYGRNFETGADFIAAEEHQTFPCKVYRLNNVHEWAKSLKKKA